MRLIPFLFAALILAPPAYAELYYWTDGQGNVHITDSLEKVPQEWRGKVRVQKEEEAKEATAVRYRNAALSRPSPVRSYTATRRSTGGGFRWPGKKARLASFSRR
ncbi:MAG: DUF4124 domain-containing protein [Deltaproteobacteria bacterium]|nr:DUF4124 domain-containing protein [Deltaproteobacteria bacterium]